MLQDINIRQVIEGKVGKQAINIIKAEVSTKANKVMPDIKAVADIEAGVKVMEVDNFMVILNIRYF